MDSYVCGGVWAGRPRPVQVAVGAHIRVSEGDGIHRYLAVHVSVIVDSTTSDLRLFRQPVGIAPNADRHRNKQNPVQDGAGGHAVPEHVTTTAEALFASQDHWPALVAPTNELDEQRGRPSVEQLVAEDETRQASDRAALVDLLGLPEAVLKPLAVHGTSGAVNRPSTAARRSGPTLNRAQMQSPNPNKLHPRCF